MYCTLKKILLLVVVFFLVIFTLVFCILLFVINALCVLSFRAGCLENVMLVFMTHHHIGLGITKPFTYVCFNQHDGMAA